MQQNLTLKIKMVSYFNVRFSVRSVKVYLVRLPFIVLFGLTVIPNISLAYFAVQYSKPLYTLPNNQFLASTSGAGTTQYFSCNASTLQCGSAQNSIPSPIPQLTGVPYIASADNTVFLGTFKDNTATTYKIFRKKGSNYTSTTLKYSKPALQVQLDGNGDKALFVLDNGTIQIVNIASSKILATATIPGPVDQVFYLAFSSSGRYAAYMNQSTTVPEPRVYELIDFGTKTPTCYSFMQDVQVRDLLWFQSKIFDFSPDEKMLYFLNDASGYARVFQLALPAKNVSQDAANVGNELDFTTGETDYFLASTSYIYFVANSKESPITWSLYRWKRNSKTSPEKLLDGVSPFAPLVLLDQKHIAFQSYGVTPGEVSIINLQTKTTTTSNLGLSNPSVQAGTVIQTSPYAVVLDLPDNYQPNNSYPVVVWLHGGPYNQVATGISPSDTYGRYDYLLEQLRKNGVIVVKADYPGSRGYGNQSYQSLQGAVGSVDVASVSDTLKLVNSEVHTKSVYIMGISYGGYLALKYGVEHPADISGVIAVSPVTDWATTLGVTDPSTQFFMGLPSSVNASLYQQADILSKAAQLRGKEIVFDIGLNDTTADPTTQTDVLSSLMMKDGVMNQVNTYQGEGHVFNQINSLQKLCSSTLSTVTNAALQTCN